MDIKFLCPRWGSEKIPWPEFLHNVKDAGYSGIEWFPFGEQGTTEEPVRLLNDLSLDCSIVMTVIRPYQDFSSYLMHLRKELLLLASLATKIKKRLFISAQTGREFFTQDQVQQCLEVSAAVEKESGMPVYQETHRNKWSYGAHTVYPVLQKDPRLKLTLDVSHWFCVSESYLEDQQEAVHAAIKQAHHIHARVGYTEGAQVPDPALEEYSEALAQHLQIWDSWVQYRKKQGFPVSTITPEFGPPPYLQRINRTIDIQQEQWRLNIWMKNLLQERYNKI